MKNKTPLIILGLIVAAVLAFALSRQPAGDPYESFSLAMDRGLAGHSRWTAQSHEVGSNGLEIRGLTVTPLAGTPEGRPAWLTIDSLIIKDALPKDRLEKVLASGDWKDQPETQLAGSVKITGLRHSTVLNENEEIEASFGEVNFGGLKLAAAPANSPAKAAGFIKALRLASFGYKNFKLNIKSPEGQASALASELSAEGLDFGGESSLITAAADKLAAEGISVGVETPLGPTDMEMAAILSGISLKSLKANGLSAEFVGLEQEKPFNFTFSLDSLEETDLKGLQGVGSARLAGLKIAAGSEKENKNLLTMNLAESKLKGLDYGAYLGKFMPALLAAAAADSDERAKELLAEAQNLGDLFFSPISLDDASTRGFDLSLFDGLISVKLDEYSVPGPYRAGEIPPAWKYNLKGLEILFPEKIPPAGEGEGPAKGIYDFVRNFGRNRFLIESDASGVYDSKTGSYAVDLNEFKVEELFSLSIGAKFGGLTPDRLERFRKVSLTAPSPALFTPDETFGDASVESFILKYADYGLTDHIFRLKAAEDGKTTAEALKKKAAAELDLALSLMGPQYLENPADLSAPLVGFLKEPKSLEITIKADPPLSFASSKDKKGDFAAIMNSLNLTVSANGQAGAPLKFVATGGAKAADPGLGGDEDD